MSVSTSRSFLSTPRALALGVLIFLVFGLSFWAPFIYDDIQMVQTNQDVIGAWQGWPHFFLRPFSYKENYEPVSLLIHRTLFLIGGPSPALFRLSNILLHWLNCVLIMLLFDQLLGPQAPSLWLAAVFAVFPSHTENIAIATFKKHILVALFGLLMLHLERPWRPEKPPALRRAGAALCLVLGLFSKENAAVWPIILTALSLTLASDWKARLRRDALFFAGLFAIDFTFFYWRSLIVPRSGAQLVGDSIVTHLLTAAKCLVWYGRELLLPIRLCQEHSISALSLSWSWPLAAVLGALLAGAFFAAWLWRTDRVALAGFLLAVLWLVPFLNLIPYLNLSLVANRYLYLSPAGALLCAASLTRRWWKVKIGRFRAVPLTCTMIGLFYADVAMINLSHYSDPLEVWECAASCAPTNSRAQSALGAMYAQRLRYGDAEKQYLKSIRLGKGYYSVFDVFNLAVLYASEGKTRQSLWLMEGMSPRYVSLRQYPLMGYLEYHAGRYKKAEEYFKKALTIKHDDGLSRWGLGLCYARKNRLRLAEIQWRMAQADATYRPSALKSLGRLYLKQSRLDLAQNAFEDSLKDQPIQIDVVTDLADLYVKKGEPKRALALFDNLIDLMGRQQKVEFEVADELSLKQLILATGSVSTAKRARAAFVSSHAGILSQN